MCVFLSMFLSMYPLQAVLQTGGQLELEVRPLFLVPDTNGFIDHLGGLMKLLQCGIYIIVVPLIGNTTRHMHVKLNLSLVCGF